MVIATAVCSGMHQCPILCRYRTEILLPLLNSCEIVSRLLHTSRSFVVELPCFLSVSKSIFLSRLKARWGRVIQNQDGAHSPDVALMTFPNWSRCTPEPRKFVFVHRKIADKTREAVLNCSTNALSHIAR